MPGHAPAIAGLKKVGTWKSQLTYRLDLKNLEAEPALISDQPAFSTAEFQLPCGE
jgi:hypothetical protein